MDAEHSYPCVNTEAYATLAEQVYLWIEAESANFEIFRIYLNTEECNLFECFQSFDPVIELCDNGTDGPNIYNLQIVFDNCEADVITYHTSLADAQGALNPIVTLLVYETSNIESTIYARVEINNQFEVFPIQLIVTDCYNNCCSKGEVDAFILECISNAVNYNGSDNLVEWNFDFESTNQIVVIYTETQSIDASWSTSQSNDGVSIEFSNVAGPSIQAITGL